MDRTTINCVEDYARIGLPRQMAALLLVEVDGHPAVVAEEAEAVEDILRAVGAAEVHAARDAEQAAELAAARRTALSALARVSPTTLLEDATVPRSCLAETFGEIDRLTEKYRLKVGTFGHAGDGNLHPTVLCDERDHEEMSRAHAFYDELYEKVLALGGTVSGEHGIGLAKKDYLARQIGPGGVGVMRRIKRGLRPGGASQSGQDLRRETCAETARRGGFRDLTQLSRSAISRPRTRPPTSRSCSACAAASACPPAPPTPSPGGSAPAPADGWPWPGLSPSAELEFTQAVQEEAFFCLDCRACTTACPSGVRAGEVMETCRAQAQSFFPPSGWHAAFREFVLQKMLPSPELLERSMLPSRLYQRLGHPVAGAPLASAQARPRLGAKAEGMLPQLSPPLRPQLPEVVPARGEKRGRVGFFLGCVMTLMYPEVSRQTVRVLAHQGFDVVTPKAQKCCGAPHLSEGDRETARQLALQNLDLFMELDVDAIVTDCAGCGAALKEYEELLAERADHERLAAFRAKVKDVSEFLAGAGLRTEGLKEVRTTVTYHEPCHLCHAQGVSAQPRQLLRADPRGGTAGDAGGRAGVAAAPPPGV